MSEQEPGPTHSPYGQDPYGPPPQGSPYGQQPAYGQSPYGQQPAYGQSAYAQDPGRRPGTVTAAAWITIVFSALGALGFGLFALVFVAARDDFVAGFEDAMRDSGTVDPGVDPDSLAAVFVGVFAVMAIWSVVALVLAVFVLKRSNVARILLVISASVTALISLVAIMSVVSAVPLIAAVAVIVMLFTGGAGDWFAGRRAVDLPGAYPSSTSYGYGSTSPDPYGGSDPYQQGAGQNPYGQSGYGYEPYGQGGQGGQPAPTENPYGQPTSGSEESDGSDHPPRDYPGR